VLLLAYILRRMHDYIFYNYSNIVICHQMPIRSFCSVGRCFDDGFGLNRWASLLSFCSRRDPMLCILRGVPLWGTGLRNAVDCSFSSRAWIILTSFLLVYRLWGVLELSMNIFLINWWIADYIYSIRIWVFFWRIIIKWICGIIRWI
jgi:hypothetical protein